jgi:thiamine-monophosphate kinase
LRLGDIGEFLFVRKILKKIKKKSPRTIVGPGDDAFVVKMSTDKLLVVTKDLLAEKIHFDLRYINFFQLGYKSMIVNLSDLAAMGGAKPLFAVVGLALPVDISVKSVDNLYSGMLKASKNYGFYIAGGDTVASKKDIVISITLFGEIEKNRIITRKGARKGDLVVVSGYFGDSAAGLKILRSRQGVRSYAERYLADRHIRPQALIDYAAAISRKKLATSMIDSSDGLVASLNFIASSSGVGMDIFLEKIPVSPMLRKWAVRHPTNFRPTLLSGGEEYELIFTVSPKNLSCLSKTVKRGYVIGRVTEGKNVRYFLKGKRYEYTKSGYQHFLR